MMTADKLISEWIEDPKGNKSEAWIDLIYNHYKDGMHWVHAGVKRDGCIHLRKAYNIPFPQTNEEIEDNSDYIHICDIDEMIEQLTKLKEVALKHFGSDWNT